MICVIIAADWAGFGLNMTTILRTLRNTYGLGHGALAFAVLAMFGTFIAEAQALQHVKVGVLRFSSSGPIFVARDLGHFRSQGLDVELVFFDAAPALTVAVASGDVEFGATALTGAFFNLAAQGALKVLAGQAREEKGRPGNAILVTKRAYDLGLQHLEQLFDKPFGLTQYGSPSHYQLGQLAARHGVDAKSLSIHAFQTLPNLVAAIKGGQVTWAIIAPPLSTDLVEAGNVVEIGRYSDFAAYQFGVIFTRTGLVEGDAATVRAFLRGYASGLRDYALLNDEGLDSDAAQQAKLREVAGAVSRYVYPQDDPESALRKLRRSALYVDPTGRLDVEDVVRQITWYREQGMLRKDLKVEEVLRLDLLE